jgi:hypothetical protein
MIDQRSIAAANVEHARTGRDHLGNQPQIDTHVLGDEADGIVGGHRGPSAINACGNDSAPTGKGNSHSASPCGRGLGGQGAANLQKADGRPTPGKPRAQAGHPESRKCQSL